MVCFTSVVLPRAGQAAIELVLDIVFGHRTVSGISPKALNVCLDYMP